MSKIARLCSDLFRYILLLGLVGFVLYKLDPANVVVFQALLIGMFLVGGTHLTRRILFHRLDLQSIATKAYKENNMAAAVVFASVCLVLVAIMFLSMSVLG